MTQSKAYSSLFDDDDYETEEDQELDAELRVPSSTGYLTLSCLSSTIGKQYLCIAH